MTGTPPSEKPKPKTPKVLGAARRLADLIGSEMTLDIAGDEETLTEWLEVRAKLKWLLDSESNLPNLHTPVR